MIWELLDDDLTRKLSKFDWIENFYWHVVAISQTKDRILVFYVFYLQIDDNSNE